MISRTIWHPFNERIRVINRHGRALTHSADAHEGHFRRLEQPLPAQRTGMTLCALKLTVDFREWTAGMVRNHVHLLMLLEQRKPMLNVSGSTIKSCVAGLRMRREMRRRR
jgi:hypothetical protein